LGGSGQRSLLQHHAAIVVPQADDKGTVGRDDLLQQLVFGVAAIQHINPPGLQVVRQHVLLIAVTGGERGGDGDPLENLKLDVVLDRPVLVILPQGPGDLGQGRQQGAIDRGENPGQILQGGRDGERLQLPVEFGEHRDHLLAVEDRGGFGQTAQRGPGNPQLLLHLLQLAGLLQRTQGGTDRVEHIQQQQGDILIHVQEAIAGPIPGAADGVELLQQTGEDPEVLEPLQFLRCDLVPFRVHGGNLGKKNAWRQ
jgi:hypothetical protein